jgi:hypothetical protein
VSALEALRELKCFCAVKDWDCGSSGRKKEEQKVGSQTMQQYKCPTKKQVPIHPKNQSPKKEAARPKKSRKMTSGHWQRQRRRRVRVSDAGHQTRPPKERETRAEFQSDLRPKKEITKRSTKKEGKGECACDTT